MLRARPERLLLKPHRIWIAVAGLSLDQFVAWGVLYYAYVVLSAPIALDLRVTLLHVAAAFSICLLIAGWLGRSIGLLLDAHGTRGVLRAGALFAPLAFASIAAARDLVSLVLAFALVGGTQALALYEPAFRTLVDWCPHERSRARATLALTMVGGFASAVFLPLTGWLLTRYGWRETVLLLALFLAVVLIPTRFVLPLPRRAHVRSSIPHLHASRSERRLSVCLALHALASTGVFIYLIGYLVERGDSFGAATTIAGVAGAAQVPGRLIAGPLRRVVGGATFLQVLLVTQAAAVFGFLATDGIVKIALLVVFGGASGMMTLERATVIVEWYGRSAFGLHQGRVASVTNTARALSPFVVEVGHRFVSYAIVFGMLGFVLAISAWIGRTAFGARATEPAGESPLSTPMA